MLLEQMFARAVVEFPDKGIRFETEPTRRIVVPPRYEGFGELEITEEGDELIVMAGHFTHSHFACYWRDVTIDEKAAQILDAVIEFLDATFADRIVFWGGHLQMGGWCEVGVDGESKTEHVDGPKFLWSGPLR
jgi:hypothetical protein